MADDYLKPKWEVYEANFDDVFGEAKFLNDMNHRGFILKHLVFNPETQTTKYYHFTGQE